MTTSPRSTNPPGTTGATREAGSVTALRRDGTMIELGAATIEAFAAGLAGDLLRRTDAGYDEARRLWNGMIDRHPALIARCASTDDVVRTVDLARTNDIVMSVRGGGHNAAGGAMCDDGIVIDLSAMQRVDVDPHTAAVRADGGVTIGVLDAATQRHGLAVPMGVVTETGIAGLTLGGGYGWLRRKYGLSCDNLVAAEVVTADGRVVRASEQENPELLWGLRGGGGNFGVVTSFEFRAHPVGPDVYFAVVMHAGTDAVDALRFYREWAATAPDEISAIAVLWHAPQIEEIPPEHHGTPIVTFVAMHSGSPTEGEAALAPLRTFGQAIADLSSVTPFLEVQQFFDDDYPKWERRYYWTSTYVTDLADELIAEIVRLNETMPSHHSNIDVWQGGGAPSRVPPDTTAIGDRSSMFMLGIEANWDFVPAGAGAAEQDRVDAINIEWARSVVRAAAPWATGARYANFPGLYEEDERPDFFGQNVERAAALKAAFDPENRFDRNQNLEPPSPPGATPGVAR
jgi:FAD/FMN-containing dehydrogenase